MKIISGKVGLKRNSKIKEKCVYALEGLIEKFTNFHETEKLQYSEFERNVQ